MHFALENLSLVCWKDKKVVLPNCHGAQILENSKIDSPSSFSYRLESIALIKCFSIMHFYRNFKIVEILLQKIAMYNSFMYR